MTFKHVIIHPKFAALYKYIYINIDDMLYYNSSKLLQMNTGERYEKES